MKTCFTTLMKEIDLVAKAIKCTTLYFGEGIVIGYESNKESPTANHLIKSVNGEFTLRGFYNVKDIQLIMKMMKASKLDCYLDEYGTVTVGDDIEFPMKRMEVLHYYYADVNNKINTIMMYMNKQPNMYLDLTDTDLFNQYLTLSSSSPGITQWLDQDNKYYITIFARMLPVNKGDRIALFIFDDMINLDANNNPISFITMYSVFKKKITVNVFTRYARVS